MTSQGHNNPPPYDPDVFADLVRASDDFINASQKWLDLEAIADETTAQTLADQISGLRGLYKKAETARTTAKEPHLEAGRKIDKDFGDIKKKLEVCAERLKKKLEPWLQEKARREEEARRAREEEARRAREEAERLEREAQAANNLQAEFEAEAARAAAEEAEREAKRKESANVKSASGAGRTVALRTIRQVEITNVRLLFMHYQDAPEVRAALQRLAEADVRSSKVDHTAIPGILVTEKRVAA